MKKDNSFYEVIWLIVAAAGVIAMALFISPLICISFGYLGGLIVELIFGSMVSNGLNVLFGTTRFNPDIIPAIAAVLAFIGSYLKPTNSKKEGN